MATEPKRKREKAEVLDIPSEMMEQLFTNDDAGRRTHRQKAPSRLPLDTRELNRQALVHQVLKTLQSDQSWPSWVAEMSVAWPVPSENGSLTLKKQKTELGPKSALDVGTGSGLWAMELAIHFPYCHCTGFDLAPCQPCEVPPNLFFEVMDMTEHGIDYNDQQFDLVHSRLVEAVPSWPDLIDDFARVLRPGGALLLTEMGVAFASEETELGPAWMEWQGKLDLLAKANHYRRRQGDSIAGYLRRSHRFRGIHTTRFDVAVGSWPSDPLQCELGKKMQRAELEFLSSNEGQWLHQGWEPKDLEKLRRALEEELEDPERHLTTTFVLTYAYRL